MTLVREGVERLVEAVLVFSRTTSDESNRLDGLPWLEPLPSRAEKYEFRDALGGRFGPDDDLDLDELGEKLRDTNPLLPGAPANAARPFEARFAPPPADPKSGTIPRRPDVKKSVVLRGRNSFLS